MRGVLVRGFFARLVMSGQLVSLVEILTLCYFKTVGGKKRMQISPGLQLLLLV